MLKEFDGKAINTYLFVGVYDVDNEYEENETEAASVVWTHLLGGSGARARNG